MELKLLMYVLGALGVFGILNKIHNIIISARNAQNQKRREANKKVIEAHREELKKIKGQRDAYERLYKEYLRDYPDFNKSRNPSE